MIASAEGGVEIEAVAERNPEAIHTVHLKPLLGLQLYQARALALGLGLQGKFAGSPPWSLMRSIVLIASPAPLTRHPMLPSSAT